ncbi:MAG: carbohydrate-binding protein, partial [Bacteroidota bacterium]
ELTFPRTGAYAFDKGETSNIEGMYVLTAAYEDNGANEMESILSKDQIILRNPFVEAESFDEGEQVVIFDFKDERKFVNDIYNNSFISFKSIDLTEVEEIEFGYLGDDSGRSINGVVELRLGSPEGKLAGKISIDVPKDNRPVMQIEQSGKADLFFVFKTFDNKEAKEKFYPLDWIYFRKNG